MKENEKTSKLSSIIMISCFLIFILGFAIGGVLLNDRDFSEMENRTLEQTPEISVKKITDGSFTADLEKYMSDQMPLKDSLVSLKVDTDRLLGHSYQNGVYFGRDGYYLQDYQENSALVKTNVDSLNTLADLCDGVDFNFMLVPNSVSVMSDKLPDVNQTGNQLDTIDSVKSQLSEKINFYCPYDDLKKAVENGTQVFYKTDHHWTSDGARVGFDGLMKAMGEQPLTAGYSCNELENFYGALYSKAPSATAKSDKVKLFTDESNSLTVSYVDEGKTVTSLFDSSFEDKKDKYSTFLGGNFAIVDITSDKAQNEENVLILKDSYANCVMPYLTSMYSHVTMIDMRYYHMQPLTVSEYIKENGYTKVICIYNVDFINSDNNFLWIE